MHRIISQTINGWMQQFLSWIGISTDNIDLTQRIILFVLMFVLAWVVMLICRRIIAPLTQKIVSNTKATWDDYIFSDKMLDSICHTLPSFVIYLMLPIVLSDEEFLLTLCMKASKIYIVVAIVRTVCTFLNGVKDALEDHSRTKKHSLSSLFQLIKLIIYFLAAIVVLSIIIDRSPLSLIAGLGAAATILMLVFKDTIVGFVSGIQLTANDMLRKGDWIEMDKNGANGVVQDVNITTVKVQNWDNTITTISPFTLMNDSFKNWRNMQSGDGRLATPTLYVDMNSIDFLTDQQKKEYTENGLFEKLGFVDKKNLKDDSKSSEDSKSDINEITNLTLYQHAMLDYLTNNSKIIVSDKYNCMVRQMPITNQGMPVQLYFFLRDKKWEHFERDKDEILSYAIVMLKKYGLKIYQWPNGTDFAK